MGGLFESVLMNRILAKLPTREEWGWGGGLEVEGAEKLRWRGLVLGF